MRRYLTFAVMFLGTIAWAQDYYVSRTGNDSSGNGSKSNPWATIAKAAGLSQPGWTIHVLPGSYTFGCNSGTTSCISTSRSGTASAPITFVSDTLYGAQINANGARYAWNNSGNYVRISGFDITGIAEWAIGTCDSGPVAVMNYGTNWTFDHNRVHDLGSASTCVSAAVDDQNRVTNGNQMYDNVIFNIGYGSSDLHSGYGIYEQGDAARIYNNLIYHGVADGVHTWHAANHTYIYDNTMYDFGRSCIFLGNGDSGKTSTAPVFAVENNVLDKCNMGIYAYGWAISSSSIFRNNLVYDNAYDYWRISSSGGCSGSFSTCGYGVTGSVSGNPDFVAVGANFHLQDTSPAVNTAYAPSAPTADLDGVSRPRVSSDIGAYEHGQSNQPQAPTGLNAAVK